MKERDTTMCGIVGYVGSREVVPILLDGIKRLEYRGYDSSGVAVVTPGGRLQMVRSKGKITALEEKLAKHPLSGLVGIAHTRWATHGKPSDENAHPHVSGPLAVVHNGIIENYASLKSELIAEGFTFASETDTEVILKLAEREWKKGKSFYESAVSALSQVRGSYAVVFMNAERPRELIGARHESPLVLGVGEDALYFASDVPAILPYTRRVVYLEDGDIVTLSDAGYAITRLDGTPRELPVHTVDWNPVMAEKAGYKHFMLKEIHEQPRAVTDTFRSALDPARTGVHLPELRLPKRDLEHIDRIFLVACGTSYHACLVGKYVIERMAGIPVEVDLASEFRYRSPLVGKRSLMVVVSQSGETADTRAALKEGMDRGALSRAIVNVVGSSLARMAEGVIYTHAGLEIGVASTKAFTAQLAALSLLALSMAQTLGRMPPQEVLAHIQELVELPAKIEQALSQSGPRVLEWARKYKDARSFLYLGRGVLFPVALEGALKLKEISYIHAEGYAAGEMKHGPIALIDETMPVMVLAQSGPLREKMISNIQEVRARGGQVLAIVEGESDPKIGPVECQLPVPAVPEWLAPILFVVPLQLLAYHVAVLRGTDVDQPRNLAKSVTVE